MKIKQTVKAVQGQTTRQEASRAQYASLQPHVSVNQTDMKQADLFTHLQRTDDAITNLDETLKRLASRLTPVLRRSPEGESGTAGQASFITESQIADCVQVQTTRIQTITDTVETLLTYLDLPH